VFSLLSLVYLTGCQLRQPATSAIPATQPSLATTQPTFWYDQPGVYSVQSADFARLWSACEETARHFHFVPDRLDKRAGVLTTVPLTSAQFFEFWNNDVATVEDSADASLATYRRTLRFNIDRLPGGYRATPRIVIERFAETERPLTAEVFLRQTFRAQRHQHPVGTPESDRGILLPRSYWYATGRDVALEKHVWQELKKRLK
jgi:hypothetical protein